MPYIIVGLVILIGFLLYKLYQKQKIDKSELEEYTKQLALVEKDLNDLNNEVDGARLQLKHTKDEVDYERYKLEECKKDLKIALDVYQEMTDIRLKEIDDSMEEQRQKRQEDLDKQFEERQTSLNLRMKTFTDQAQQRVNEAEAKARDEIERWEQAIKEIQDQTQFELQRFDGIVSILSQYEKDRQEKLFYTIQLLEEYQEDIEFLLTTVAAKVQHPDIISKLVWAEYVKPNLDETFKRIEIKAEPGIYKLTSLENGKCYIGKSTNVKTRIADHFKSAIGIKSIADQAVHHAILKEGFWNWQIEIITYCDKNKLSELEKYYIDFFKAQEFGYNKNAGG